MVTAMKNSYLFRITIHTLKYMIILETDMLYRKVMRSEFKSVKVNKKFHRGDPDNTHRSSDSSAIGTINR